MIPNGPLSENLAALKAQPLHEKLGKAITDKTPECEVIPSKKGAPTLYVNGVAVHSRYDPLNEARTMAGRILADLKSNKIILIGMGLGYLAEELIRQRTGIELVIVEVSNDVYSIAMRNLDLTNVIRNSRLIVEEDVDELYEEIISLVGGKNELRKWKIVRSGSVKNYAPEISEKLVANLHRTQRLEGKKLRILVVGPLYGGSLPVARYVTNAFKSLGHKAELLDNSIFNPARNHLEGLSSDQNHKFQLQGLLTGVMAESITARALEIKAQIVFFIAQSPATPEVLAELKRIGIPTAFWFVEDGYVFEYGKKVAPLYDVFFHIQKGTFEKELLESGARSIHYLPMAADPDIHHPLPLTAAEREEFGSNVSHLGAGYFNRRHFFLGLLDYDFKLWGSDWEQPGVLGKYLQRDGQRISTANGVKIFNATEINLNLHSSTYTQGVNPHGDFVNPRTFEVAACGGFQVVDERSLLGEMYQPGKELVTFTDLQSCRESIDYYLANPGEAEVIAEAARVRTLKEHTYRHRMEEALEVILENHEPAFPEATLDTVSSLVEEASDDEELAEFFRGLGEPDEELTLEGIADTIKHRQEELGENEALFLLMNEFYQWAKQKGVVQ